MEVTCPRCGKSHARIQRQYPGEYTVAVLVVFAIGFFFGWAVGNAMLIALPAGILAAVVLALFVPKIIVCPDCGARSTT